MESLCNIKNIDLDFYLIFCLTDLFSEKAQKRLKTKKKLTKINDFVFKMLSPNLLFYINKGDLSQSHENNVGSERNRYT